jgi:redox-regulated HSP33 family molecular chaperone
MMGPSGGQGGANEEERGLTPRVLEELFKQMERRQRASASEGRPLHYRCSCSYLQVYNDNLT